MPVCHRAIICPIYYIYITSLAILAGCFGSTKSSNDEGSKSVYFWSYSSNIFIGSFRIIFLFYLTNNYKYTKHPGKKQEPKKQY